MTEDMRNQIVKNLTEIRESRTAGPCTVESQLIMVMLKVLVEVESNLSDIATSLSDIRGYMLRQESRGI